VGGVNTHYGEREDYLDGLARGAGPGVAGPAALSAVPEKSIK
jgi:hypothetical protein